MAVMQWRGIDARGKKVRGAREADNPKALRAALRREGVLVTQVSAGGEGRKGPSKDIQLGKLFKRVSTADVALETRQLATLLSAGIPLVEALGAMIDQVENADLKDALVQVRARVNEGANFADALRAHPKIFSPLYISMVSAGEASGHLETVLTRVADFLENQARLKNKVFSAMAYPAFMAVIGMLIIWIMMVVVVPKVTAIFESFKQSLPWYTRVLIWTSDFIGTFKWVIVIALVVGIYSFRRWRKTAKGRTQWDTFVLKAPQIGELTLLIAVGRFARTLSTLLAGGVPLLTALEITKNVLGNTILMASIEEARGSIREGESIAATLKRSGRFPPIAVHMIAIGERSGQLEQMLDHVAGAFDTRVENRLTAMTALLEPLMIVLMGGTAGLIAFAILMPLLKFNEFIQ